MNVHSPRTTSPSSSRAGQRLRALLAVFALAAALAASAAVHAEPRDAAPGFVPQAHDADADGILDVADNCPAVPNGDQRDEDADRRGDACDTDRDDDGVLNVFDNCPMVANASQDDRNGDGIGDRCEHLVLAAVP